MRLAVLDTNVIVSAGIRPGGAPARLILNWVLYRQVELVLSPFVVAEYREVVRREKFRPYGFPPPWLEVVLEHSLWLPEPEPWPIPCPDPKDAPFLALAHRSGAWLISGNRKHFPADVCADVAVLTPAEYLIQLEERISR